MVVEKFYCCCAATYKESHDEIVVAGEA